ncbi:hypothetical protein CK203_062146 [Vitis vinifera]|uniref:Uncharacterized protein n=1 Tax=Vitis vinifera TaxID=29760 RepID=A0A438G8V7_VITVI|nr:hypothetical protein CK203_062146 [Vitis vinifera]
MARTRGAKSSSPSNRKKNLRKEPVPDSAPEPSQSKPIPPPVKPVPPKPPARRYLPVSSPVPSPSPLPVPSPVPSPAPQEKSQEPQVPLLEPQIQAETVLEEVIRRPMLPQPPIRALLQLSSIQSEARACPIIPAAEEVRNPTLIHFTIDGRHGILGARHIAAEALQIPFEPTQFDNFRAWANPTELEMVRTLSRGAANRSHLLRGELPPTLLYFEERFTKRKLQRADCIPLLFPRLLCQILEHLGYPSEPQLEKKANMPYITVAAPAIPRAPPAASASSQPSTSAEPRMAIPISEYRDLCRALETLTASQSSLAQEMAAIRACQEQILATQAQQAAILRQLQVHFDLPTSCRALHFYSTEPHPHPSESHPPEPQAPADTPTEEADPSA